MNIYYVYLLLDPRNFYTPFYVGKGKNLRWQDHLSSKRIGKNHLKNAIIRKIRESGQEIGLLIWQSDMAETEAFALEKELIARFGRRVDDTGILANMTTGGEGVSGYIFTEKDRERCRERMRGAGSPTYGVGHTDNAKMKMSISQRRRVAEGYLPRHSDEHKRRLREHNPGGEATARPIIQFDAHGAFIKRWPSVSTAAKELSLSKGNIGNCASKSKTQKCGGYFWRYEDEASDFVDGVLTISPHIRGSNRKSIIQKDVSGSIICVWDSLYTASEHFNVKYATLWAAAKNRRMCAGFLWDFA